MRIIESDTGIEVRTENGPLLRYCSAVKDSRKRAERMIRFGLEEGWITEQDEAEIVTKMNEYSNPLSNKGTDRLYDALFKTDEKRNAA